MKFTYSLPPSPDQLEVDLQLQGQPLEFAPLRSQSMEGDKRTTPNLKDTKQSMLNSNFLTRLFTKRMVLVQSCVPVDKTLMSKHHLQLGAQTACVLALGASLYYCSLHSEKRERETIEIYHSSAYLLPHLIPDFS